MQRRHVRLDPGWFACLVTATTLAACSALPSATWMPSSSVASPVAEATPTPPIALPTSGRASPTPTLAATPQATPQASGIVAYTNPNGPADETELFSRARKLATFAGLWRDPARPGVDIAVTKDTEGAIAKLGPYVPAGMTVYFQLAPYTEQEVCALRDRIMSDRDELLAVGILIQGGGCGNMEMTASIDMSPVTSETIAYMEDRYPGPTEFESIGVVALRSYEPPAGDETFEALTTADAAALITCGQRPFAQASLGSEPVDVSAHGPELAALRESFSAYQTIFGDLAQQPWLLVEHDQYGATFLSPRGDGYLEEMVVAGQDGWVPTTLAECQPISYDVKQAGSGSWTLDRSHPVPDSSTRELHVFVTEGECADSSSPAGRIQPPVVEYGNGTVTLTVAVRFLGGIHGCPGNPSLPVTIVLPEPLGDRKLAGASDF